MAIIDKKELERALRNQVSLDELKNQFVKMGEQIQEDMKQEEEEKEAAKKAVAAKNKEIFNKRYNVAVAMYKYFELLELTNPDSCESDEIGYITNALEKIEPLVKQMGYANLFDTLSMTHITKQDNGVTKFTFSPRLSFIDSERTLKQSDTKTDKKRTMNHEDDILAKFLNEIFR